MRCVISGLCCWRELPPAAGWAAALLLRKHRNPSSNGCEAWLGCRKLPGVSTNPDNLAQAAVLMTFISVLQPRGKFCVFSVRRKWFDSSKKKVLSGGKCN